MIDPAPLQFLGDACGAVTARLRSMSVPEREFWTSRAYTATRPSIATPSGVVWETSRHPLPQPMENPTP